MHLVDNATSSQQVSQNKNPETAATVSGLRVKHLSSINNTSCNATNQADFQGGSKI